MLSTPASDQGGPTTFHQDRNEGLEGGARTNSSRVRKGARAADPEVPQTLQDEWEAHHLVSVAAARRDPRLLAAAVRAGWRMDDASNTAPLPASQTAQQKLRDAGVRRPIHDNGHPTWNKRAVAEMAAVPEKLRDANLVQGSPEYDQAARKALEAIQAGLRRAMLRLDRVTRNEEAAGPHEV